MKFVYITCYVSMLEPLTLLLEELGCANYQVVEQVTARSQWGEPRQNNAVWPGYNSSIFIQESDLSKVNNLMEKIEEMNSRAFNNGELIVAFTLNVDNYIHIKPVD
ncbi:MAG: PG0541 family transporter-associated protein [Bacteroidales bacterium]